MAIEGLCLALSDWNGELRLPRVSGISLEMGVTEFTNPTRLEAIPLKLGFAYTRRAEGEDAAWIRRRFTDACAAFGTEVAEEDGRLVTTWR